MCWGKTLVLYRRFDDDFDCLHGDLEKSLGWMSIKLSAVIYNFSSLRNYMQFVGDELQIDIVICIH